MFDFQKQPQTICVCLCFLYWKPRLFTQTMYAALLIGVKYNLWFFFFAFSSSWKTMRTVVLRIADILWYVSINRHNTVSTFWLSSLSMKGGYIAITITFVRCTVSYRGYWSEISFTCFSCKMDGGGGGLSAHNVIN